jgi:hypothetical protein
VVCENNTILLTHFSFDIVFLGVADGFEFFGWIILSSKNPKPTHTYLLCVANKKKSYKIITIYRQNEYRSL